MELIRVIELEGNSQESWQDAVGHAVSEATRLLRPMISDIGDKPVASSRQTRLDEYSATIRVAFIVEIPGSEMRLTH